MSKFKKKRGAGTPAVSTASLPDIVFMLLFFFMVVTVIRQNELMVDVSIPTASELVQLEDKNLIAHIYIGKPGKSYEPEAGTAPRIQLNDKFRDVEHVQNFIREKRANTPDNMVGRIVASLRIDNDVTMGLVTDVKTELRKVEQLKINYAANQGDVE